jgi:hypothetical protein
MKKTIRLPDNIKTENGANSIKKMLESKGLVVSFLSSEFPYYIESESIPPQIEKLLNELGCVVEQKLQIYSKCDIVTSTTLSSLTDEEKLIKEVSFIIRFSKPMTDSSVKEFIKKYPCKSIERVPGLSTLFKVTTVVSILEEMLEYDNVEHVKSSIPLSVYNAEYHMDFIKDKRNDLNKFNAS